ncbi:MAG: dockerin type I domain-containing protein, partial [Tepidisphaeraceae bacterium]
MEQRFLMSVSIQVQTNMDDAATGGITAEGGSSYDASTLRQAINYANTLTQASIITFSSTVTAINLNATLGQIDIATNPNLLLNINNVVGVNVVTVSGGGSTRVFNIDGADATFGNLIVTEGYGGSSGGGGILEDGGNLTLTNCTVSFCTAADGGAIFNTGTTTLTLCAISGCAAEYSDSLGNGAAIDNSTGGTLDVIQCTISGDGSSSNIAAANGGGLYNSGICSLSSTQIATCYANRGGGIYNASSGTISMTGTNTSPTTVSYDQAVGGHGGGLANQGYIKASNTNFDNDSVTGTAYGGGIYNADGGTVVLGDSSTNDSCAVSGDYSSFKGAGIYNGKGSTGANGRYATLKVYDSTLSGDVDGDSLPGSEAITFGAEGGGVKTRGYAYFAGDTITDCTTALNGGGISNGDIEGGAATLTLKQCTLSGDTALAAGGGIFNLSGSLYVGGSTVGGSVSGDGCTAGFISRTVHDSGGGGGVYSNSQGECTMNGCTIEGDSALGSLMRNHVYNYYYGGGGVHIRTTGGTPLIEDCTISGDSSDSLGGGVVFAGTSAATIDFRGDSVVNDTAFGGDGGGIYSCGSNFAVSLGSATVAGADIITSVSGDSCVGEGGGVFVGGAPGYLAAIGCDFGEDTATTDGGGICVEGPAGTLTSCTASYDVAGAGNSTDNFGGGGIYAEDCTLGGDTITNDQAADEYSEGGGLAGSGSTVTNCTISNDSAPAGSGVDVFGDDSLGSALSAPDSLAIDTGATLDVKGYDLTVGGLSGSGTLDDSAGGTPTLTVSNTNTGAAAVGTFAGTIQNTSGVVSLTNTAGTLVLMNTNKFNGVTTISGGALVIDSAGGLPADGTVVNNSMLSILAGYVGAPVNPATVTGTGTISVGTSSEGAYLKLGSTLGSQTTSTASSLIVGPTSALDITNNTFIISFPSGGDPASAIRSYLTSGYDGDTWNGVGIISSNAALNVNLYAVGYVDGSRDAGTSVYGSNEIEIKNSIAGDSNLDGTVNFADLLVVAQNFNKLLDTHGNALDWADGDFNYDGTVNFADLLLVAQNFNKQLAAGEVTQLPTATAGSWDFAVDAAAAETVVMYVDPTATDSNDTGISWADAFPDVQTALGTAQTIEADAPGTLITIDVAQGTYSPGTSSTSTFQMINDVSLYGGYPGYASGNPDLDDCNVSDYPTVLYTSSTTTDAVTATGTNASAVINGFTIADAGAPVPTDGIEMAGGSPTIADCIYTAPQYVWVADGNYEAIQEFASSGSLLVQSGTWGTGDGDFLSPEGVATDANGNVWVTDVYNNRVEEFTPSGVFMMTFGSYGS